jgi:ornithine cyclodeaminase/alanine dehydrogenase-like protein (mu-crystallin family)
MLILTEDDLRKILPMGEVIRTIEKGFLAISRGEATPLERLRVEAPWAGGVMLEMPGSLPPPGAPRPGEFATGVPRPGELATGALGTKLVTVFPNNSRLGLATVQAFYILLSGETGAPIALMEGRFITAIRTAATSAVATKFMAGPGPKQLAIIGAGVEGEFHIEAMQEICDVTRVLIASRSPDRAEALASETQSRMGIDVRTTTAGAAASSCNLICTCTTSPTPLFDGRAIKPGTHINAIGAFAPDTRELDTETIRRARVVIDAESAAGREAGEVLIPLGEGAIARSHIAGELADVVSGKVPGRTSPDEITVFKSCGLAIEDLVTARLAYQNAMDRSIGTSVEL